MWLQSYLDPYELVLEVNFRFILDGVDTDLKALETVLHFVVSKVSVKIAEKGACMRAHSDCK